MVMIMGQRDVKWRRRGIYERTPFDKMYEHALVRGLTYLLQVAGLGVVLCTCARTLAPAPSRVIAVAIQVAMNLLYTLSVQVASVLYYIRRDISVASAHLSRLRRCS